MAPYVSINSADESITSKNEVAEVPPLFHYLTNTQKVLLTISVLLGLWIIYDLVLQKTTKKRKVDNGNPNVVVKEFVPNAPSFPGVINRKDPTTAKWRPESQGYH